MSVDYNRINALIEAKKRDWDTHYIDNLRLDSDSIQFLLQFTENWHQSIKNGLFSYESSTDDTVCMIEQLLRFIQKRECVLYLHLENWKRQLERDPQFAKDYSADHDIVTDVLAIEAELREQEYLRT